MSILNPNGTVGFFVGTPASEKYFLIIRKGRRPARTASHGWIFFLTYGGFNLNGFYEF
jgi:hypothetical protein